MTDPAITPGTPADYEAFWADPEPQTPPPAPLCADLSAETPEPPPVHTPNTAQAVGSEN